MSQHADEPSGYRGPTPPPDEAPIRSERHWIDRPADLEAMVGLLLDVPVIAVDAEFVAARPANSAQVPRLALIQIADQTRCFVVDAQKLNHLAPLQAIFQHERILKIFHGVGSDLRVLGSREIYVRYLLDIEAVSRAIFGQRESGLQAMLQRACNVHLDKTLQRSDWLQRPLSTAMFAYAARDAEMTFALYAWLQRHFSWATELYLERPDDPLPDELAAQWLATIIEGGRTLPQELVADATETELAHDCIAALQALQRPPWRSRVFRAAADLVLAEVIPYAERALTALSAEERAAAARALGRLRAKSARAALEAAMLDDPVHDVRHAAANALEQLELPARSSRFAAQGGPDIVAESGTSSDDADAPWKSRLRDLLDKPDE